MTDILPVSTGMGFGNGDGFGADALGAFGGALIGSWFGDAWGGGWGRGGHGSSAAVDATGFSTQILNDGINAIQNSINGMNMNLSSGLCNVGYNQVKPEFFGLYFYPFFFYAKKCRRMIA